MVYSDQSMPIKTTTISKSTFSALMLAVFFGLAISLSPLYLLPSGGPQLTDFVFLVFSSIMLLTLSRVQIYLLKREKFILLALILLCTWVLVVSIVNTIYFSMPEILFPSLFYIYNVGVAVTSFLFLKIFPGEGKRAIKVGALFSVIVVMLFWVPDLASSTNRVAASFNNPNQLAYYSLVLISILLCICEKAELLKPFFLSVVGLLAIYILSSSSLTAISALFLSLFGVLLKATGSLKMAVTRGVFLISIMLVSSSIFMMTEKGSAVVSMVETRFLLLDEKLVNVGESRGYSRIVEFPEYVFIGAAERGRDRFGNKHGHEIHSTFGTMLFSYGVVGLSLFLTILLMVIYRGRMYHFLALGGPLIYSTTHNGLRFTLFWLLLIVIYFSIKEEWDSVHS